MHKPRRAARQEAWRSGDIDHPNYNPFGKIRSRSYQKKSLQAIDEENGLRPSNRSEAALKSSMEQDRRIESEEQYPGQRRADTMPPLSADADATPRTRGLTGSADHNANSQDSEAGISGSTVLPEGQSATDGRPRKRFGRFLKFTKKDKEDNEALEKRTSISKQDKNQFGFVGQIRATLLNSWINILFLMVPVGIAVHFAHLNPIAIFVINFIAIIPLAAMLSYATEEIAFHTGETFGGLLNATFGNAVELIVSIIALVQGQVDIVQESLIGSMLSNLLLVMGMCFFGGGVNRVEQQFNITVAQTSSSLLSLAIASLIIPAAFEAWAGGNNPGVTPSTIAKNITSLSRGTAVLLLLTYAAYLFFQLKSHAAMFNMPSPKTETRSVTKGKNKAAEVDAEKGIVHSDGMSATVGEGPAAHDAQEASSQDSEDPPEEAQLRLWVAILTLGISTAFVGICAEFMTSAINLISPPDGSGTLSRTFVGLILLPIVGNAAEHATAVTVAIKDKMDLAIGVAIGSSMQIALLVIPFVVVLGWILGNENMNLAFDGFQIAILFVAVLLVNYLIQDGKSNWLEGVLLMALYMIIAIAAWYYPSNTTSGG